MPLVRAIIYSLDDSGYLMYGLEEVLRVVNGNAEGEEPWTPEEAEAALAFVQDLEPRGVGARNVAEALLLQITDDVPDADLLRRIVRDHLDDVEKNRVPKIAKELGITVDQVNELVVRLSHFDPRPGAALSSSETYYITPDVVLEWVDGDYDVRLEDSYIPTLRVSPRYLRLLNDHRQDPKVRDHLRKKIDSAKWLIEAIAAAQNTLERVARRSCAASATTSTSASAPEAAQDAGGRRRARRSTSPPCRARISDKYVQTHRGIVPLKFFFTGGTESDDGGDRVAGVSVKERVRQIIEAEDEASPLSDDEVAERLHAGVGLNIARRTVTKYRKALRIPSSRQRRVWS